MYDHFFQKVWFQRWLKSIKTVYTKLYTVALAFFAWFYVVKHVFLFFFQQLWLNFGAKIDILKIGLPMSKLTYVSPCELWLW